MGALGWTEGTFWLSTPRALHAALAGKRRSMGIADPVDAASLRQEFEEMKRRSPDPPGAAQALRDRLARIKAERSR